MNKDSTESPSGFVISALYKFVKLIDFVALREPLARVMEASHIKGTLLLAEEGINGTVAGSRAGINKLYEYFKTDPRLASIESKESFAKKLPFKRSKVKLKQEIVTMGVKGIDPNLVTGTYVDSHNWNALISDPNVLLIDTRNDYEVEVGTFKYAINPKTENFREFPQYVCNHLDAGKHKKVAMFCTGGIRCEKSTALLKAEGFEQVYHLKGGILKYLEDIPEQDSLWKGECYVFDDRVTVNHQLQKGKYEQCYGCRFPITPEDKMSTQFEAGVSCPRCYNKQTERQKKRFSEREKQITIAVSRNESHLGSDVIATVIKRRHAKKQIKQLNRKKSKQL